MDSPRKPIVFTSCGTVRLPVNTSKHIEHSVSFVFLKKAPWHFLTCHYELVTFCIPRYTVV